MQPWWLLNMLAKAESDLPMESKNALPDKTTRFELDEMEARCHSALTFGELRTSSSTV